MKIYIQTQLEPSDREQIAAALGGHDLFFQSEREMEEGRLYLSDAEVIMGNPPVSWMDENLNKLLFWQLDSAGFDQYKQVTTQAKVANMGNWYAHPSAETIVGGIVALYRGIDRLSRQQVQKKWERDAIRRELKLLFGQRVVVLGVGTIGSTIRTILTGFGCKVKSFARTSPQAEIHSRPELMDELKVTDLVVNALPGTTEYIVDKTFLESMKEGSVYANVGRGSTTDEEELIRFLKSGHLSGAVLDVTAIEPLPENSPLWTMTNVLLTQHTAGGWSNENKGKIDVFIENVKRMQSGAELLNLVNLQRGY